MNEVDSIKTERLDQRVVALLPRLSRAFAAKLVEQGKAAVNGAVVTKPGFKLKPHDEVTVDFDEAELDVIPEIDLPVLYEDDDCVVINKPVGVLTHSKGAFNPEATVATWLYSRMKGMDGDRAGIVHRLDRATSGVMICAKTPEALSWLQKQFSQRRTKKTYQAVIAGALEPKEAIIDMPIERNPKAPATFRVGMGGKPAKTHYKVLQSNNFYTLVELKPETGRTHQLRVHLRHLKHPIVGDAMYGGPSAVSPGSNGEQPERLFLHAASLELTLPNRSRQVFTAPVPKAFKEKVS